MTAYMKKGFEKEADSAIKHLLSEMLEIEADYLFLPGKSPYSNLPMPMLISDGAHLEKMEPLARVMAMNSAKQASLLLGSNSGKTTALVLKPCEKRALFELVKLNQCTLENAIIITADCHGRVENSDYLQCEGEIDNDMITSSCRTCTQFISETSDIHMNIFGCPGNISFSAGTEKGKAALEKLDYGITDIPDTRAEKIDDIMTRHRKNMDALTEDVLSYINKVDKFQEVIGNCLNCYNCMTICPVCYCKECVFKTDIFSHMPETLMNRADKKGVIKLPTDTTMFHMTRLAHMSHACVGCGQCTSVCPSNIPVADIFKVVSKNTQDFFDYMPGENIEDNIPYLNYKEKDKI